MISLAVANAIVDDLYQGKNVGHLVHWGTSPILGTGEVAAAEGIWVNAIATDATRGTVSYQVTVSTRFSSPEVQALMMQNLRMFALERLPRCELVARMRLPDETKVTTGTFSVVTVDPPSGETFDAVDAEGHWIKSFTITMMVRQKMEIN